MSSEAIGWQDELRLDHRRRVRNGLLGSVALHGVLMAGLLISPRSSLPPLPDAISVELVAAPPSAAPPKPAPKPAPTPRPRAAPEPAPAPAPEPAAAVAPPPPKAPVQVLPEQTPGRIQEAPPKPPEKAPEPVAKAEPKPEPRRPARDPALSYEDAMAELDEELGEDAASELLTPAVERRPEPDSAPESSGQSESRAGVAIAPELAAWNLATRRRIQSVWVTPAQFRGRGLATTLDLRLSADGDVLGEPKVARSSGDPYFDDNAVRAVLMASPLPPPPRPGRQVFVFRSEVR